jgi:hypothetical protein
MRIDRQLVASDDDGPRFTLLGVGELVGDMELCMMADGKKISFPLPPAPSPWSECLMMIMPPGGWLELEERSLFQVADEGFRV